MYQATHHGGLLALDAATGQERWRLTSLLFNSSPVVVDGTVYIGSGRQLWALDAVTGRERWKCATDYVQGTRPVVADGTVYTAGGDGVLWAVDAATGRRRWKQRLRPRRPRSYEQFTSPAVAHGRVYVSFPYESLWAVDAATGEERWKQETGAARQSSAAVAEGTVYIGSEDMLLWAVDAVTGEERWRRCAEACRATTRSRDQCTVRGLERWSDRTAASAGSDPSRLTAGAAGAAGGAGGADGLAGTACGPARNRQENATDTAVEVRFGSTGSGEAVRIEQREGFATGQAATEFPPGTARGAGRCERAVLTGLEHRLALGRALLRSRFSPHAPQGGSYSADPHGLPLPGAADTVGRATGIEWRAVPASGSRWVRRATPGALGRRHGLRLSLTSRA